MIYGIIAAAVQVPLGYAFDKVLQIAPTTQGLFGGGSALHAASLRRQIVGQISSGLADLLVTPFLMSVITVLVLRPAGAQGSVRHRTARRGSGLRPADRHPAASCPAALPRRWPPPRRCGGGRAR